MAAEPRRSDPETLRVVAGRGERGSALDPLVHERMRLAILSALAVEERLGFVELKEMLGATDGNLSVHAKRLEEGKLIRVHRRGSGPASRTEYSITARGRRALLDYLDHMESLIATVRRKR